MLECDGFMPRQPAFEKICLPCPETRLSTHLPNYRRSDAGDFRWSKFNFRFSLGTRIMLPSQTDNSEETAKMKMHSRSEEHTSELQSLMRTSYAVFRLKK